MTTTILVSNKKWSIIVVYDGFFMQSSVIYKHKN